MNDVYVAAASGGEGRNVTQAIDRNIARAIWMPDGKSLLVGGNDTERVSLWQQPLDWRRPRQARSRRRQPQLVVLVDMAVSKTGAIAFTGTTPTRPAELYYMTSPTAPPKRLTDFNAEIAALPLGQDRDDRRGTIRRTTQQNGAAHVSAGLRSLAEVSARAPDSRRSARRVDDDVQRQRAAHGGEGLGRLPAELSRQRQPRQRLPARDHRTTPATVPAAT